MGSKVVMFHLVFLVASFVASAHLYRQPEPAEVVQERRRLAAEKRAMVEAADMERQQAKLRAKEAAKGEHEMRQFEAKKARETQKLEDAQRITAARVQRAESEEAFAG